MGYTTEFEGVLKFVKEPTIAELVKLKSFMGEDVREHPEWIQEDFTDYSYIQWEITPDYSGIQWEGSEKFYCAVESINLILVNMRAEFPGFGFTGELLAQGEDFTDRWKLVIRDGKAVREEIEIAGEIYRCPHCEKEFLLADAEKIKRAKNSSASNTRKLITSTCGNLLVTGTRITQTTRSS